MGAIYLNISTVFDDILLTTIPISSSILSEYASKYVQHICFFLVQVGILTDNAFESLQVNLQVKI